MRYVAMGVCLAFGIAAGFGVGKEIADVFAQTRWLPWAAGAGTAVVVFAVLYLPLLRPVADMVGDRFAALRQDARATCTGSGLDEIPVHRSDAAPRPDPRSKPPVRR